LADYPRAQNLTMANSNESTNMDKEIQSASQIWWRSQKINQALNDETWESIPVRKILWGGDPKVQLLSQYTGKQTQATKEKNIVTPLLESHGNQNRNFVAARTIKSPMKRSLRQQWEKPKGEDEAQRGLTSAHNRRWDEPKIIHENKNQAEEKPLAQRPRSSAQI
jgi:hypothetical protein